MRRAKQRSNLVSKNLKLKSRGTLIPATFALSREKLRGKRRVYEEFAGDFNNEEAIRIFIAECDT